MDRRLACTLIVALGCGTEPPAEPVLQAETSSGITFVSGVVRWDFADLHGLRTVGGGSVSNSDFWGLTAGFSGEVYDDEGEITEIYSGDAEVIEFRIEETTEQANGWPVYRATMQMALEGYGGLLATNGLVSYRQDDGGYMRFTYTGPIHVELFGFTVDCEADVPCVEDQVDGLVTSSWSAERSSPTPTQSPTPAP